MKNLSMIKKLYFYLLLILIILLSPLFIVELGTRLLWIESDNFLQKDNKTGMIHKPDFSGRWKSSEYDNIININSDGFVGKHYKHEKDANIKRAIMLGDSMVESLQVPVDNNFSSLLENKLSKDGEYDYDIINMGVSHFATGREYLNFKHYGLNYNPDMVILNIFIGNDIWGNYYEDENNPHTPDIFKKEDDENLKDYLLEKFSFLKYLRQKSYQQTGLRQILVKLGVINGSEDVVRCDENNPCPYLLYKKDDVQYFKDAWGKTEYFIGKIKELAKENNIKLAVVIIPSREQLYEERWRELLSSNPDFVNYEWDIGKPQEKLIKIFDNSDIIYLDLLPYFRNWLNKYNEKLFFEKDGHLNPRGHKVTSEALYSFIINNNLFNLDL